MLDPATGEVVLASSGARLGPTSTRTRFLESALGEQATISLVNEPWARYALELPPGEIGPFPATVQLQFNGEALYWITVMDGSPEFGESWDDWSRENELARRAAHDRWRASCGAPAGRHEWGLVWSDFDDKSGFSSVVIRYDEAGTRRWWKR
jgi:hypothetical protein